MTRKQEELAPNKVHLWDLAQGIPLPDESVDCIMTSPPYYALRDYKTEPSVWGGDPKCEHRWESEMIQRQRGTKQGSNAVVESRQETHVNQGQFCSLCSAWRGNLGLEPTLDLYLDHLLWIMAECKRVLKKSGTLWVNLGDSYGGSGGSAGHTPETKNLGRKTFEYGAYPSASVSAKYQSKSLLAIPARFQIRMIEQGWILRNIIIWAKQVLFPDGLTIGSVMPSSVKDRFNQTWEYLFFFTKSPRYYFDLDAVRVKNTYLGIKDSRANIVGVKNPDSTDSKYVGLNDPFGKEKEKIKLRPEGNSDYQGNFTGFEQAEKYGTGKSWHSHNSDLEYGQRKEGGAEVRLTHPNGKNPGSVWQINPEPLDLPHFAAYPTDLCRRPILAGSPEGGLVLDPFCGIGTTGLVALQYRRRFIGFDNNPDYVEIANKRLEPFLRQEFLSLNG